MEDEIHYCVNCGVPLEPGNWYKCDACLEAELGISSPEYAPPGMEDTFDDYEKTIDERWGGGENRSDEGGNDDGGDSDDLENEGDDSDGEDEDDNWVDEGLKEIAEQKRKEKIEEYRKRRGAA